MKIKGLFVLAAILLFSGNCLHSEQAEYIKRLKELAEAGNAEACLNLGNCFFYGKDVKKDWYSAFNWYYEAAKSNNPAAQFNLALCYDQGYGTEQNKMLAVRWYQRAADNGVIPAKFNSAMFLKKGARISVGSDEVIFKQDAGKAFVILRDCSRAGFVPAERELAKYYLFDLPQTTDNKKSGMIYLLSAVKAKDPEAVFILARIYLQQGEGFDKVFPMMKIAAKGNIPEALEYVGEALECGRDIKQDRLAAVDYYRRAAERGSVSAQVKLGDYYTNGIIVEMNIFEARKWYLKAAEKNDPYSLFILGTFAEQGIGCLVDKKSAFQYYQRAAGYNFAKAQFNLALYYANGIVVKKDVNMAFYWYRKAALQNDPQAQCELGFWYLTGIGNKQNYDYGLNWLTMSEKSGNDEARDFMSSIQMQDSSLGAVQK